jgi:quercetin dioxygenase-like cupin family protein
MLIANEPNVVVDRTDSMYPCVLHKITNGSFDIPKNSTVYGFVVEGSAKISDTKTMTTHEFFSINSHYENKTIIFEGTGAVIVKYGFHGQNVFGGPVEKQGRLCYINHCSDSLLVYPPRLGDPSMSLLHFPPNIVQDFHTHPSFRLGIVFRGHGFAECKTGKIILEPGAVFCMEEQEVHRFVTTDEQLSVISFHPDGDWGPTDHDHTLLNRTYLKMK